MRSLLSGCKTERRDFTCESARREAFNRRLLGRLKARYLIYNES